MTDTPGGTDATLPGRGGSLSGEAAEILDRVRAGLRDRGLPPQAYRRLVLDGMVVHLAESSLPPAGDADPETVTMDTAVAAVSGVVAGMIRWEAHEDRRHRQRLTTAAQGGPRLGRLSAGALVAGIVRRAVGRLRGVDGADR